MHITLLDLSVVFHRWRQLSGIFRQFGMIGVDV